MKNRNHKKPVNRKKLLRKQDHLTRPPRLKNKAHKYHAKPIKKKKKIIKKANKSHATIR